MSEIFDAVYNRNLEEVQYIIEENPECMHIKEYCNGWTPLDYAIAHGRLEIARFLQEKGGRPNLEFYCHDGKDTPVYWIVRREYITILKWVFEENIFPLRVLNVKSNFGWTPLDVAIACGKLEIAKFLFEKDGRPNLDTYCDGKYTPVHYAAQCRYSNDTLKWVFAEKALPLRVLNVKNDFGWTLLDCAIAYGNLEIAKFLFEKGGRLNLEEYRDGNFTPVHWAARFGHLSTLKWIFDKRILPLCVYFQIRGGLFHYDIPQRTPLEWAIDNERWKIVALLRRLLYLDPVFLAMQRTKRDYNSTLLRRLPDELLDMVIDEVAQRLHLKVAW